MTKLVAIGTVLIATSTVAASQEHPSITAQPNTIWVSGEGKFEAEPDTAILNFGISAQEQTAAEAYTRASKTAEQVRQILRSNHVAPEAAEIGFFAIQPIYDYKTAIHNLIGYRVNSNVAIKLKDFSKVGPMLHQFASADVTDNQRLSYTLEDKGAAKSKAVLDAYRQARNSADALARAGGRTVGELLYAAVDSSENPLPVRPLMIAAPRMAAAEAPPPTSEFSPQMVTVTAHIGALFRLQ
jgi:uncharacterized protein